MSEKRRTGLGRGLGALIPGASSSASRPVDVFFPGPSPEETPAENGGVAVETLEGKHAAPGPDEKAAQSEAVEPRTNGEEPHTPAEPKGALGVDGDTDVTTTADEVPPESFGSAGDADGELLAPDPESAHSNGGPALVNDDDAVAVPTSLIADAGNGATTNGHTEAVSAESTERDDATSAGLVPVPGATFAEIPVDAVIANAHQPRQVFDEDDLEELAGSIREVGVLQPVVVRRIGDVDNEPRYELIMGERRWRASRLAGNETVPAIVRDTADNDLLRDALLENLHRVQLNPLEEAAAYQQLLEDFGCTHDELASRISRSRPQISNTLRLLKLPPLVQRRVAAGVLSAGHARALLGLSDAAAMERLAQRIVAEGLSVRATEEIVALGEEEPLRPELRRRPRAGEHSAALEDLGRRLSDRWDTKVKIALGQRKGRISIEFASVQDLNRILDAVSPQDSGVLREATSESAGATGTDG